MASKDGKKFEESVEKSCKSQKVFYHRIKDVFIPPKYRNEIRVPKNQYDSILFNDGYLFPIEFKSTEAKSISFSESIIKEHQIKSLQEAAKYDKVISGFIFNFRECSNFTCFIHINDFITYQEVVDGKRTDITYKNKTNKKSMPIDICKEIGVEILNRKKKVNYFYDVKKLLDQLSNKS